jgi:hypothetical protein
MLKKKPEESRIKDSGSETSEIFDMIMRRLDDQATQIQELFKKRDDGGAQRVIADAAYNPPRDRLSEFSIIPNSAIEAFALAKTCGSVLDEKVLNGEISLCEIHTDEVKRLFRGKGGKLLGYAAEQAKEEARKTGEVPGEEIEMGKGM